MHQKLNSQTEKQIIIQEGKTEKFKPAAAALKWSVLNDVSTTFFTNHKI